MLFANLDEILKGITPSLPVFIGALLGLAFLLVIVIIFMYKPIKKSIDDRKKYIAKNIEASENRNNESKEIKDQAKQNLIESREVGKEIIQSSVMEANSKSNKILTDAKDKSHQIIDSARAQAQSEINSGRSQIKKEAVDLAFEISEKIINEKIDEKTNKKMIDDFIKTIENEK